MATSLGSLIMGLTVNANSEGMEELNKKINTLDAKIKHLGEQSIKIGKSFMAFGAVLSGVGIAAGKMYMDFESAFAGVRKTVDATEAEYALLAKGIRDMAKSIPASTEAIAGVAEAAGQLGIKKESILSFTRTMIDLGNTTDLSAEQAAMSLAKFANITQMSQDDVDKLGSTIVALGNNMATTEAAIVDMGMRLASSGKQLGMTEAEIMALSATLSSLGLESQAGGTAISKLMIDMASEVATGGEKLKLFAGVAGMSANEFSQAFKGNASLAIATFVEGLGKISDTGGNTFGVLEKLGISEVRMRDATLRASGAGDILRKGLELGNKAWADNNALSKEAEERYKTMASKLAILWNKVKDLGVTFGESLAPTITKTAEEMGKLLDNVSKFVSEHPGAVKAIVTITAALGVMSMVIGGAAVAMGALALTSVPFIAFVASITAVITAVVVLWQNWADVIEKAKKALSAFFEPFKGDAGDVMFSEFDDMGDAAERAAKKVADAKKKLEDLKKGTATPDKATNSTPTATHNKGGAPLFDVINAPSEDKLRQIRAAELAHELAVIDLKEKRHELSRGEATAERLRLHNEQLASYKKDYAALVGVADKELERLETLNKIVEVESNIVDLTQKQKELSGSLAEGLSDGIKKYTRELETNFEKGVLLAQTAAQSMESAFMGFFDATNENFMDMGKMASSILKQIYQEILRLAVIKPMVSGIMGGFGFADGGVMTSEGSVPLKTYSNGGIAYKPQLALFGEGRTPEAYVPLPDGRRIPAVVDLKNGGGGGATIVNIQMENKTNLPLSLKQTGQKTDEKTKIKTIMLDLMYTDIDYLNSLKGAMSR